MVQQQKVLLHPTFNAPETVKNEMEKAFKSPGFSGDTTVYHLHSSDKRCYISENVQGKQSRGHNRSLGYSTGNSS